MAERHWKLEPTLYQVALADYLRAEERELWAWFASAEAKNQYVAAQRSALRQSAQVLEAESEQELLLAAAAVKAALEVEVPLRLYTAQPLQAGQPTATLYYVPGEAHIVLSAPLLALLAPEEMQAILGHELAHYVLWERQGGQFLVADRILQAMTEAPRAPGSHHQSARRYRFYTEIFADRGSLAAVNDLPTAVRALAKMETGARQVNAGHYLKAKPGQRSRPQSGRHSHPELVTRAQALRLWAAESENLDVHLAALLEGGDALAEADLLDQVRYTRLTRRLLRQLLRPRWFQTQPVLAHAKLFFGDYQPAESDDPGLVEALRAEPKLRQSVAYLLLDFAMADPALAEFSRTAAWDWSRKLNMDSEFETLLVQELKLKSRELKLLRQQFQARLKAGDLSLAGGDSAVE